MNTNTILIIGGIGAVGVVGYLLWKKAQDDKLKLQLAATNGNPNQRSDQNNDTLGKINQGTRNVVETIDSLKGLYGGF